MKYLPIFILLSFAFTCDPPKDVDTLIETASIQLPTNEQLELFDYIKSNHSGILVENLNNSSIQRVDGILGSTTWRPVNGYKSIFCGTLDEFDVYSQDYEDPNEPNKIEYDWNFILKPDNPESLKMMEYVREGVFGHPQKVPLPRGRFMQWHCSTECLEAEITPPISLRKNKWFNSFWTKPTPTVPGPILIVKDSPLEGESICVYGPWVYDSYHNWRPEIHPCEAIWWEQEGQHTVMVIQDVSRRFDDESDYELDNWTPSWQPWLTTPTIIEISIPFEYDPRTKQHPHIIVDNIEHDNLSRELSRTNYSSDNSPYHKLRHVVNDRVPNQLGAKILVEVTEKGTPSPFVGVKFTDVCKTADGKFIGIVKIASAVGISNDKLGYQILTIKQGYVADAVDTELETAMP